MRIKTQALILERANTSVRPTGTVFGRGSSACLPLNDIDFCGEWEREKSGSMPVLYGVCNSIRAIKAIS
jgi:hypothetical protein